MKTIGFEDFRGQGGEIEAVRRLIEENRMVHALLITGEPGTGKRTLADLTAAALLCTAETGKPCGRCENCRRSLSGEHPDITIVEKGIPLSPETSKGRATIPVDDIREVIRICSQYSFQGGNRAVIIRDAEHMTEQAQNCLLKILEEPPQNTYFFLTTAHPDKILTTVRSRCRPLKLIPWDTGYTRKLLTDEGIDAVKAEKAAAVSSGSIGAAFRLAADEAYWQMRDDVMNAFFRNRRRSEILRISTAWKDRKAEADTIFGILEDELRRLLQYRLSSGTALLKEEYPAEWLRFAAEAPLSHFTGLTDRIRDARKQSASNVTFQAIIEQLLLAFTGESDLWVK